MSADKAERLYFSTARVAVDYEQLPIGADDRLKRLKAALAGDLIIVGKGGTELVRRCCLTLGGPDAVPLKIELEPDSLESVQLPPGLIVIFDCRLDPAAPSRFKEEFTYTIWFKGTGEPIPFDRAIPHDRDPQGR